jgi:hypothetical protein
MKLFQNFSTFGGPRRRLLEAFLADESSVLFATDSF